MRAATEYHWETWVSRLARVACLVLATVIALPACATRAAHAQLRTHAPAATSTNTVSGAAIVQTALRYVGYRYTTFGISPQTGFSCIGLVSYVYGSNGIPLPDELHAAMAYAPAVPFNSLEPGDILFFQNTVWTGLSHTAIYLGGGRFVHAEWYNRGVRVSSFYTDPVDGAYWIGKYLGANRPWQGSAGTPSILSALSGPLPPAPPPSSTPTPDPGSGPSVTVDVAALNVRTGPSRKSTVEETIPRGTSLAVQGTHKNWYKVLTPDGTMGWVVKAGVTAPNAPAATMPTSITPPETTSAHSTSNRPPQATIGTIRAAVRVHRAPVITAAVITVAPRGAHVRILERLASWTRIQLPGGISGYVISSSIQM